MISSTTCPAARAGRHAKAIRTRQSFFIEFLGPPRFLGLRTKGGLGPIEYFTPSERSRWLSLLTWTLWQAGELAGQSGGPHQGQGGSVVARRCSATESIDSIEDGGAECLSTTGRGRQQKLFDAFHAEFLAGMLAVALALDDSARNE